MVKKIVTLATPALLGAVLCAGSLIAASYDPTMPADEMAYRVASARAEALQASLARVLGQIGELHSQYKREVEVENQGQELSDERVRWYRGESLRLEARRDNLQTAVDWLPVTPAPIVTNPVEIAVTPDGVVAPPTHEVSTMVAAIPQVPAELPEAPTADAHGPMTVVDRWLANPWTTALYGAAGAVAYAAVVQATGATRVIAGIAGGVASAAILKVLAACRRHRVNRTHDA